MQFDMDQIHFLHKVIEDLSLGIDPTSGIVFSKDTLLNSKQIRTYLSETAELLDLVSKNIEWTKRNRKGNTKGRFHLDTNEVSIVGISTEAITVSKLTYLINLESKAPSMRRLRATQITSWLKDNKFLDVKMNENNNEYKIATAKGERLGIISEVKKNTRGEIYCLNLYNVEAQKYIIRNINEIATKG